MSLMLHTGGKTVGVHELNRSPLPVATRSFRPIHHGDFLNTVREALTAQHLEVVEETHGLWGRDDARYFGVLSVRNGVNHDDRSLVVGVRNSHDKSFPAGLVIGTRVFVCDNLSFSGEVKLIRKHTARINEDLPGLVSGAVGKIAEVRRMQDKRIETYKNREVSPMEAHDLIVRAMDLGVIGPMGVEQVLQSWRKPEHPEFVPRNAWSLFNAFTERQKGIDNLNLVARRTMSLHGLLDSHVGLVFDTAILN